MSTTFGIPKRPIELSILLDEDGYIQDYIDKDFFEEVFFRTTHASRWLNHLASRLPYDTAVFALDNDAQGVHTIQDCQDLLNKQNETNP